MLKGQHLGVRLQRRVQILQKQLFLRGAGVESQIQRFNARAAQNATGGQLLDHAAQRIVAAGAVGAAEQHHTARAVGLLRGSQHKGAAERLDQSRHKGVLPQHLRPDRIGHAGKIRLAGGCRGRGRRRHRAAEQSVLLQRFCQVTAHFAHALGRGGTRLLHTGQHALCGGLPLLGGGQGIQLGLHLLHCLAGLSGLAGGGGVFAAAHQAADPCIVAIFQTHDSSSFSGLMPASAPAESRGSLTV